MFFGAWLQNFVASALMPVLEEPIRDHTLCAFAHDLFSLCKHIDHLFINFFGRCVLRSSGIQTLAALMIFLLSAGRMIP